MTQMHQACCCNANVGRTLLYVPINTYPGKFVTLDGNDSVCPATSYNASYETPDNVHGNVGVNTGNSLYAENSLFSAAPSDASYSVADIVRVFNGSLSLVPGSVPGGGAIAFDSRSRSHLGCVRATTSGTTLILTSVSTVYRTMPNWYGLSFVGSGYDTIRTVVGPPCCSLGTEYVFDNIYQATAPPSCYPPFRRNSHSPLDAAYGFGTSTIVFTIPGKASVSGSVPTYTPAQMRALIRTAGRSATWTLSLAGLFGGNNYNGGFYTCEYTPPPALTTMLIDPIGFQGEWMREYKDVILTTGHPHCNGLGGIDRTDRTRSDSIATVLHALAFVDASA